MLLTEEEAKERWCPFARTLVAGDIGFGEFHAVINRTDKGGASIASLCVASRCVAWRWQPLQADEPFMSAVKKRIDEAKDKHPAAVKYVRANLAEFGLPDKPYIGFCGLAGKP